MQKIHETNNTLCDNKRWTNNKTKVYKARKRKNYTQPKTIQKKTQTQQYKTQDTYTKNKKQQERKKRTN